MPNLKPISGLRNYTEVLREAAVGAPVFLTRNGRGKYAIADMRDDLRILLEDAVPEDRTE